MNINFALDYSSARRNDADGHMFVGSSVISAAQINPYSGAEIPNYSALGLDPERKYMLLRDPAALEAAVPGLHGKPLLIKHRAQTRSNYDPDVTVGSVMNPQWVSPNVMAELSIIHPDGVRAIESGEQTDLSAGYHYTPILEPGTFNGQPYDGRMTDIRFNHVALVSSGRVDGAVVGDAKLEEEFFTMDKQSFYRALNRAEDRAVSRIAALRQAERDCARFMPANREMAFDGDAEEIYRAALTELGCAPEDLADLELEDLKKVFRIKTGASITGPGVGDESKLSSILAGATSPQLTGGLAFTGLTGAEATSKNARGMAGDSRGVSPLDAILKGISRPVDMSRRQP